MSHTDRYIRIAYNYLPENKSDYEKIKNIRYFFEEKILRSDKPNIREIVSNNIELSTKITENGLEVIDANTGERRHIDGMYPQYMKANYKYGGQILDIAIIKTILEAKPNMSFDDYVEAITNNIKISHEVVNKFSYDSYIELKDDKDRLKNLMGPLIIQDGQLTQDAVEIVIISEMVEEFYKTIMPVVREKPSQKNSPLFSMCNQHIDDIIARTAANISGNGGSILKGELPSKFVPIILSGLVTMYRDEENRGPSGKIISSVLEQNDRRAITSFQAAKSLVNTEGLAGKIAEVEAKKKEVTEEKGVTVDGE